MEEPLAQGEHNTHRAFAVLKQIMNKQKIVATESKPSSKSWPPVTKLSKCQKYSVKGMINTTTAVTRRAARLTVVQIQDMPSTRRNFGMDVMFVGSRIFDFTCSATAQAKAGT
jgi:hypothetical protein